MALLSSIENFIKKYCSPEHFMALADKITDLEIVLAADVFYTDRHTQQLSVIERSGAIPAMVRMKEILHRDKEEIRRTHDIMKINYRTALRNWFNGSGDYLQGKADIVSFNAAYEQMLAYYAGKVVDEMLQVKQERYDVPAEVLAAHNRYWREMPTNKRVLKTREMTPSITV